MASIQRSGVWAAAMMAALVLMAIALRGQTGGVEQLAREAMTKQAAGDYGGAAVAYQALLKLDPNQVATHVNLGIVLVQLGRFDEAITQYNEADRLLPGDPRIALNIALAYSKSGRTAEAAQRLATLHSADPDNRQVILLLADARLQTGKNQDVIDLLQPMARAGSDEDLGVAYMLGLALLRTGRVQEGQAQLDRILRHGESAEAHFLLGTRMFEAGDYAAAVAELAKAASINPKLAQLQSLYGRALLETGDPKAAQRAFEAELAQNPGDARANAGLGQILAARGQFAEALPYLRKAIAAQPKDGESRLALAQALVGAGQLAQALPAAKQSVEQTPDAAEAHAVLADVERRLGQVAAARQEAAKAEQLRKAAEAPPHVGDLAPDFDLGTAGLRQYRERRQPLVLVFGSYSCPNFRAAAEALRTAYQQHSATTGFLLVYIREAHAAAGTGAGSWESTRNQREAVAVPEAKNLGERAEAGTACLRRLHLPFASVPDTMDGKTERAYAAWPSRLFVIGEDGKITYSSRLTELDFHPGEFERALHFESAPNLKRAPEVSR